MLADFETSKLQFHPVLFNKDYSPSNFFALKWQQTSISFVNI